VEPGRKVIAISPRCRPSPCVPRLKFIKREPNFHRIVMRTKKGVNRNCGDEGSFFDELWKSVGVIVNCCRLGSDYEMKVNRRQATSTEVHKPLRSGRTERCGAFWSGRRRWWRFES